MSQILNRGIRKKRQAAPMNKSQSAIFEEVPSAYRNVFFRAYSGSSRSAAVKAFCLHCTGYLRNEVRDCTAYGCPLYPYRPYQTGDDDE